MSLNKAFFFPRPLSHGWGGLGSASLSLCAKSKGHGWESVLELAACLVGCSRSQAHPGHPKTEPGPGTYPSPTPTHPKPAPNPTPNSTPSPTPKPLANLRVLDANFKDCALRSCIGPAHPSGQLEGGGEGAEGGGEAAEGVSGGPRRQEFQDHRAAPQTARGFIFAFWACLAGSDAGIHPPKSACNHKTVVNCGEVEGFPKPRNHKLDDLKKAKLRGA